MARALKIQKYGNTTDRTIPLRYCDYEKQLKKGDGLALSNLIAGSKWAI